ncbi:MAG TPA: universal stress protein [Solirubrobacteraceae bacterium]
MIIIGYDGSADARAAIKQAGILMPGHPALVLTVWGPPAPEHLPQPEVVRSPGQARAEELAAEGALLGHQLGIDCRPGTRRHRTTVAAAIVAEARRADAQAIIVGRGGHDHAGPLGSVARAVVREARCAVLVAGAAAQHDSPADPRGIGAVA